jgi:hypothetical protein
MLYICCLLATIAEELHCLSFHWSSFQSCYHLKMPKSWFVYAKSIELLPIFEWQKVLVFILTLVNERAWVVFNVGWSGGKEIRNNTSFGKLKLSSHVKISMFLHQIQGKELADSKMGKFLIRGGLL